MILREPNFTESRKDDDPNKFSRIQEIVVKKCIFSQFFPHYLLKSP